MEWIAQVRGKLVGLDPDAIQIAIATFARAEFFLTNDKRLPSLPGLQVLVLDDLKKDQ